MGRQFTAGTLLAALELQMMMVLNFTPRKSAMRLLGGYHPTAEDVDCWYCLQYQCKGGCQSRT